MLTLPHPAAAFWQSLGAFHRIVLALGMMLVLAALLAPWLAPFGPTDQSLLSRMKPPAGLAGAKPGYLLGTDELGRDLLSRCLFGLRLTLSLAALGTLVGLLIGATLGLLAGVTGGRTAAVIMAAVDMQIAIPFTLVALFVLALFGSSFGILILLLGFAGWEQYARIVAAANMSTYLDPGRDHSNVGSQLYCNSFDPLIEKDYSVVGGAWKPGLATAWTLVEPTIMELKLREGVIFHNGEAMTADDVAFSLNRMFQATFAPYQVRQRDRLSNFDRAEKVDDFTVRVVAKRAEPLWETLLNLQQVFILPMDCTMGLSGDPKVAEDTDYEAFSLAPVGTGPYKVAEFVPGEKIVWERFDGFWGEAAPLDRATVRLVPEVASRLTSLKTGEADIATNIAPDQLALIEGDADLKAEGMLTPLFHVMILNQNHPELKDARIRQALLLAIVRTALNEALWLGKALVPDSHTMAEYGDLYMPELKTIGYDPEMMARNWSNPMYFADPFGSFGVMWAPRRAVAIRRPIQHRCGL
jgi:ABC-type transport system substrate-binding protein